MTSNFWLMRHRDKQVKIEFSFAGVIPNQCFVLSVKDIEIDHVMNYIHFKTVDHNFPTFWKKYIGGSLLGVLLVKVRGKIVEKWGLTVTSMPSVNQIGAEYIVTLEANRVDLVQITSKYF